ncbi:MAG: AAA family ATPase, partial [Gammaproteobacteria bacterium]|nr:AAA family ATPase [Gammaproteobacteria bacterium]
MYEQYFQLTKTPFRFSSEPELFFFGNSHKNALTCLRAAMSNRKAVITLFGLPGTGKTTLVQKAINELIASDTLVYRISRAFTGDVRACIISELCDRLNFSISNNKSSDYVVDFFTLIRKADRNILLIIDESQILSLDEWDFIHQIAAHDDNSDVLIKLVLIGHAQARNVVHFEDAAEQSNFVISHCELNPLSIEETQVYVEHRLSNCGWVDDPSFSKELYEFAFSLTRGIPRQINAFFDRLLQFMEFDKLHALTADDIGRFSIELHRDLSSDQDKTPDESEILTRLIIDETNSSSTPGLSGGKDNISISDSSKNIENNISINFSTLNEKIIAETGKIAKAVSAESGLIDKSTVDKDKVTKTQDKVQISGLSSMQVPQNEDLEIDDPLDAKARIEQINMGLSEGFFGKTKLLGKVIGLGKGSEKNVKIPEDSVEKISQDIKKKEELRKEEA